MRTGAGWDSNSRLFVVFLKLSVLLVNLFSLIFPCFVLSLSTNLSLSIQSLKLFPFIPFLSLSFLILISMSLFFPCPRHCPVIFLFVFSSFHFLLPFPVLSYTFLVHSKSLFITFNTLSLCLFPYLSFSIQKLSLITFLILSLFWNSLFLWPLSVLCCLNW